MPETLNQVCAIHFHSLIWRYSPPLQLFLLSMREMTKTDHYFLSGFYEISKRFVLGQRTNNRSKDSVTVSRIIEKFAHSTTYEQLDAFAQNLPVTVPGYPSAVMVRCMRI